jgi:hypothetical protein
MMFLLIGLASALYYLRQRRWIDAVLVLAAAIGLAGLTGRFTLPAPADVPLQLAAGLDAGTLDAASAFSLEGDGLRAGQWRDLPARPLIWHRPAGEQLRLDFPRQLTLGRNFVLTLHRTGVGAVRLQLLAENDQVVAESVGNGADISVQWLPPVAEAVVLKARLLGADGKVLAQGPIPVLVRDTAPLQVVGRFAAPSFDLQALNTTLTNSGALLDWQVRLGKVLTRAETARAAMPAPNVMVVDAAYFEQLHTNARTAMLAQVANGLPLIVLGGDAADAGAWSQALQLELKAQPEQVVDAGLSLQAAPFVPQPHRTSAWHGAGKQLWARSWHSGRIVWVGASDWHRYAITDPQALGSWWQSVLDSASVQRVDDVVWEDPEEMPVPGQRLAICAQGTRGIAVLPELKQELNWQPRTDKADASCIAVWPRQPGWLRVRSQGRQAATNSVYVFAESDWPQWQRAQKVDATTAYMARTPGRPANGTMPSPAWPFALLFTLAMLLLWWRERR